jgi:hypothetical protein
MQAIADEVARFRTVSYVGEFDHIVAAMEASPLMAELKAMGLSGEFSKLDRHAAKRHHDVPQFVLRGFADPADGGTADLPDAHPEPQGADPGRSP